MQTSTTTTTKQPHSYDYCVRDKVSLAKLFVKPFMLGFTGFDETLDSSAALSILCEAPNFVYQGIDIIARDVRDNVRNEWGHCTFAKWTEPFYLKCFQLMEKLVTSLKLSEASKKKVLGDLQEWRNRGNDMCFGQQISNEVFQLVHNEMRVLSTTVEENKDSWVQDHEGLRDNLDSLRERFASSLSKLEEKHVALESDLISVKEDQLKTKETVASLSRGIDKLSKSGLHWKLSVVVVLLAIVLFLYEQSFGECGMFHYWYSRAALFWKILVVILLVLVVVFLYQHFARGTMFRYWYCSRGCIPGHELSFVFKTFNKQTPKVNGIEFDWEELKNKLGLTCEPMNTPGMHYYLNIDRCAYGGIVPVASWWDNTPQVRGAEIFAVNSDYTQVYYEDDGEWHPYRSARDIYLSFDE